MRLEPPSGPAVVVASGRQVTDAGALTAEAYLADRLLDEGDSYERELRDAERRAEEATLLVATVPAVDEAPGWTDARISGWLPADRGPQGSARRDDVVVGTITIAAHGTSYAEIAVEGEVEVRMLAVAPEARGRGIAEALVNAALRHAVAAGAERVVLSTLDSMQAAQRLYARLGFEPQPERDWGHGEVRLRVHAWTPPPAPGVLVESATWPPVTTEVTKDGWRVGLSAGLTRRGNSALPLTVPVDLVAAVADVEERYAAHGQASILRVGPGTDPDGLAELLTARGYASVSETDVLVRVLDGRGSGLGASESASDPGVRRLGTPVGPAPEIRVADAPDEAWVALWLGTKSQGTDPALARALLQGAPADYLSAVVDGRVVATMRVARAQGWAGLSCLVVADDARRRGLGRVLSLESLRLAAQHGCDRAFLQVEIENMAAARLYASLGFRPAQTYHYVERVLAG